MRRVGLRVLAGICGVLAAASGTAAADPLDPSTVQTVGMDYSGLNCPLQPVKAVAGANTTLAITTATNFSTATQFEIPQFGIRVPLPFAFSAVRTDIFLGKLRPGVIAYRIDGPPPTGSYGGTCQGTLIVTP